jgi:Family of unknown function (DUF6159)
VLDGREASFSDAVSVALSRLGCIAGWAAYSLVVAIALCFLERFKGARWLGKAAEIAWSFATFFVVPLIAFDGLGASEARRRSFELARANWKVETGGLGALRVALFVPMLLFAAAYELLRSGHVHSHAGQAALGLVLAVGIAVGVVAGVVRQVFAISLYRASAA